MDRIAPTLRPDDRVVMRQSWRRLAFLHWEVPAESLAKHLPPGLTLDTFEGRAFVGLVPFTMEGVRPEGFPAVRGLSDFHETNVRTYVHHEGRDPGVWFFSLDAANLAAVATARAWFGLNYQFAAMSLKHEENGGFPRVEYASRRRRPSRPGPGLRAGVVATGSVRPAAPGSLEHFLAERYVLYTCRRGRLYSGRVHHVPYPLREAECDFLDESLLAASGLIRPDSNPLTHYAESVDVEVFGLKSVVLDDLKSKT